MSPFNELDCRHGLFPDYLPGVQRNIRKEKKKKKRISSGEKGMDFVGGYCRAGWQRKKERKKEECGSMTE